MTLGLFSTTSAGKNVIKNGIMGVVPMLIIISLLALFVRITSGGTLFGAVGFLLIGSLPIGILASWIMWKKGIIKVVDKTQVEETAEEKQKTDKRGC